MTARDDALSLVPPTPLAAWMVPGKLYRIALVVQHVGLYVCNPGGSGAFLLEAGDIFLLVGFHVEQNRRIKKWLPSYGVTVAVCSPKGYGYTVLWLKKGQECVRVSP